MDVQQEILNENEAFESGVALYVEYLDSNESSHAETREVFDAWCAEHPAMRQSAIDTGLGRWISTPEVEAS